MTQASSLLRGLERAYVVGDRAYDSNALRHQLQEQHCKVVIPCQHQRAVQYPYSRRIYRRRHRIENFFQRLKRYRRVAMRFEKLAANFLSMVRFAAALTWIL
jgi:transposase